MKKAIVYARVGFAFRNEKPNRLLQQISELKIYCQENEIEVEAIYSEVAQSMNFKREEFEKLIEDIKTKKVKPDFLLFTEWHHLSTNVEETIAMFKWLKENGIEARAITDGINSEAYLNFLKKRTQDK